MQIVCAGRALKDSPPSLKDNTPSFTRLRASHSSEAFHFERPLHYNLGMRLFFDQLRQTGVS
jgi:hypothetical protein